MTNPGDISNNNNTNSHTEAVAACRWMDTVISTPEINQAIFTDTIDLFPDAVLHNAHAYAYARCSSSQRPQQGSHRTQKPLKEIHSKLQQAFYQAQQALALVATETPTWKTASSSNKSLTLDPTTLDAFDKTTAHLLEALTDFETMFARDLSPHLIEYQRRHRLHSGALHEQDTIPGLGEEARSLVSTQDSLLQMLNSLQTLKRSFMALTDPSLPSGLHQTLAHARKDLLRTSSDEPDIQTMLDRLSAMSMTLERTLQRIRGT